MIWFFTAWAVFAVVGAYAMGRLFQNVARPGLSRELRQFMAAFSARVRSQHPDVELRGPTPGDLGLILAVEGQEVAIPLRDVLAHVQAFPSRLPETVDHVVQQVRERLARVNDWAFDEVFERILPQVRTECWIRENSPPFGDAQIVSKPILEDLRTCFVIDEPEAMVFVTAGHLRVWQRSVEDLESLAIQNLKRLAEESGGVPMPEPGTPRILHTGDGYDAAKILLAPRLLTPQQGDGLLFAIPERDTLWVATESEQDHLEEVLAGVREVCDHSGHPVSDALYRLTPGGFEKVQVGASAARS